MKYTHTQAVETPQGTMQDSGTEYTGSAQLVIDQEVVPANGQSPNILTAAIPTAGLQCIFLLATVPCTVTLTGSDSAPVLVANQLTRITALNADVTGISVGANSTSSGPAGMVSLRALYDATP